MSQRTIGNRGPQNNYLQFAKDCVAMRFPHAQHLQLQANYDEKFWHRMVLAQKNDRDSGAYFIMRNSEEGQAIIEGITLADLSQEYLLGLPEPALQGIADKFKVKTSSKNPKAVVLAILAKQADGFKVKEPAASGV